MRYKPQKRGADLAIEFTEKIRGQPSDHKVC